ncbi:MAG: 50S ribosomal protein L25 [Bacteroidales bacterium]
MKTVSMSGALRAHVGKKDAKRIRREGKVPCVLYGGKEQYHFSMEEKAFKKIIFTPKVYLLKIKIDNKEFDAILQDIQYHPVTDAILHADFLAILPGNPVTIGIPLHFNGNPPGVLAGGKLRKKRTKLLVKGLIQDLPDYIDIDISKLELGDILKVKDVSFPNLEFLEPPGSEVVGVKTARGAGMGIDEVEGAEGEEGVEGEAAEEEGGEAKAEGGEAKAEGGN